MLIEAIDDNGSRQVDVRHGLTAERLERQIHRRGEVLLFEDRCRQDIDQLRSSTHETYRPLDIDSLDHAVRFPG